MKYDYSLRIGNEIVHFDEKIIKRLFLNFLSSHTYLYIH